MKLHNRILSLICYLRNYHSYNKWIPWPSASGRGKMLRYRRCKICGILEIGEPK